MPKFALRTIRVQIKGDSEAEVPGKDPLAEVKLEVHL